MTEFSKFSRPDQPGVFVNWQADTQPASTPNANQTVAVVFTNDWGPDDGSVVALNSLSEFRSHFGPSVDTEGYAAVYGAFQGEGIQGKFTGAGTVLARRILGSAAAVASHAFTNTTPASALTISARYKGTKGNDLRITIQDDADDNTKDQLLVLDGTVELERFTYTATDIAGLVAQINAPVTGSQWITAVQTITGVALSPVTGTALTGGNDGITLVSGDWTAAMDDMSTQRFAFFAPANLTDSGVLAALVSWARSLNAAGQRFITVVGGASGEAVTDAITRSASIADPDFVNFGGFGHFADGVLGNLSSAQMVPRLAGILSQRGEGMSATFARFAGGTLVGGPATSEVRQAFLGGVVTLSTDSNPDAPVRIAKSVTTFTSQADPTRPLVIYRNPKFVHTMDAVQIELQQWAEANVIGKLPVNDKTRLFIVGEVKARLKTREILGVIQPGSTVVVDPDPPSSDSDEFVAILIGLKFGRSTEQIFFTALVA